jgi:hypothetical protein
MREVRRGDNRRVDFRVGTDFFDVGRDFIDAPLTAARFQQPGT